MIKVFHAQLIDQHDSDTSFMLSFRPKLEKVEELIKQGKVKYVHVADVATDDSWKAFEKTNHINHDWTHNPEVTAIGTNPKRSTSAGDVIVKSDGTAHLLKGIGAELIPNWADWIKS